jgi:hypothetical protein
MDQATAIEQVRERYARGGVPLEEFRRLVGTLMVTTDPAECEALLRQLPPAPAREYESSQTASGSDSRRDGGHHIMALFGQVDRRGNLWDLGPETQVTAAFGEVNLDIRMARLTPGENVLRLNAVFGEINVVVPEGLLVRINSQARFGEVNMPGHQVSGSITGDSTTLGTVKTGSSLYIEAVATFGEVNITTR